MTELVGHFLILALIIIGFLIVPLLIGRLVRPKLPTAEKDAIYECGEPTIGTSYIQFDLRFYVVALLFIVFDVEIAFFFPWAKIYGQATQLADTRLEDNHIGQILPLGDHPNNSSFPIRFNTTVKGTFDGEPKDDDDKESLAVTLTGTLPKDGGPFQLRFTSGKLADKMFRVRRYKANKKTISFRDDLPVVPQKGVTFVIDNYSKKVFAGKSLQLQWTTGANSGTTSDVVKYNPETTLLTLAKPVSKPLHASDKFAIVDPARVILSEKILSQPAGSLAGRNVISSKDGLKLAIVGFFDILIFFAVLLVGFAYVWKRGDLDWVRAVAEKARQNSPTPPALANKK